MMAPAERIAVVGAGLMGHGIALVFAAAGHRVAIHDPDLEVLQSARARIRAGLEQLGRDDQVADAIELHDSLANAVREADLVVEAVPEELELKRSLFHRLAELTRPDTILASNTSVIRISELAQAVDDPGRVVGTHFWNPPFLVPLVEVIAASDTRPDVVRRTIELLTHAGKEPVHVRIDLPGGVGNRLQHALWREAIALVDGGVVDAAGLDRIVKRSFGTRLAVLGPIENADLVGLDLTLAIHEYLLPHIAADPEPAPLLRQLVADGQLGAKTGQGFCAWTADKAAATRQRLAEHLCQAAANSFEREEKP